MNLRVNSHKQAKEIERCKAIARELAEGLIQSENDSITRERADALERQAVEKQLTNDRERAIFLQKQIEELKQKELKAQALSREEEQLIQKKAFLSELEAEREARARKIEQRECGRALLRQHNAALRRRSRQVSWDNCPMKTWLSFRFLIAT
ncbi:unnamed protein product [Protopolystoma xenopodis]|uniref:Trichohyalin-plectin-homology domain-containing protein n=1 Tax=Protopolystoma xenopodis TaxID=117903 RepID=A0A3S5ABB5_9PLAT|nr:unnamed protein product [Protopolystoma xenopodis]